jgi:hypothetical protein
MAPDRFHHLEGTYPEAGLFRLYLYDDYTQPLDPKGFQGVVHLETAPESDRIPLTYDAATRTLVARLQPAPKAPVALELYLDLADRQTGAVHEALFNFDFSSAGKQASSSGTPSCHAHADHSRDAAAPPGG